MKKAYRVKSETEFQRVFHHGKSTANRQFVVYVLQKNNQKHFRVGISVGKKLGNAVVRNRVKRKIRQAVLELDKNHLIRHDVDFIVIARAPSTQMTVEECKQSLKHVFRLANLLQKSNT